MLGRMVQTYNPSTQETEAGGLRVKASLSYIARPLSLKKMKVHNTVVRRQETSPTLLETRGNYSLDALILCKYIFFF
jgi:hypothetical protein